MTIFTKLSFAAIIFICLVLLLIINEYSFIHNNQVLQQNQTQFLQDLQAIVAKQQTELKYLQDLQIGADNMIYDEIQATKNLPLKTTPAPTIASPNVVIYPTKPTPTPIKKKPITKY